MNRATIAARLALCGAMLLAARPGAAQCTDSREGQYFGDIPSMSAINVGCWLVRYDAGTTIENSQGDPVTLADFQFGDQVHADGCNLPDFTLDADRIILLTGALPECTTEFPGTCFMLDAGGGTLNLSCWTVHFTGSTAFENSKGDSIHPASIPPMAELVVTGCLADDFTITASRVVWNTSGTTALASSFDEQATFGSNSGFSYRLLNATEAAIGTPGVDNPALTLEIGRRYMFSHGDPAGHPFALVARGATPAGDSVVLAQGASPGSLEEDPGVDWVDTGSDFYFTVTPALATALGASNGAGYRSNLDTTVMRGTISLVGVSAVEGWEAYE